ncbi:acyl-CoA dehydrogenase family protein [Micromonospora sp. 4G57]|uniref:Acyl-CoA dehydrogenase family protein n=1 Tax=Micromonospora sicca TaxID=2202420 RepID=A0ABU5JLG4_9ACTN|nr:MULTISPECIES: acyl-CoA dehydrogenase family protein [unclassified Micromonospora]MDZ5446363.1 acyl-CoA dehydrogenase family protein [Micromonospora sp. 4G57]MDZ5493448.1 acyl-CoA dehydrogenase family protein [Micromonospora sp. 4G53]
MTTDMHQELAELRRQVREVVDSWWQDGRFTPICDAWLRSYDAEFSKTLAARGWIGITWPRELGGQARSNRARLVVTEELLRGGAPVAAHWIADRQIGPAILRYGSPSLQREYLPRIASGEVTFCLGMSETESGSDLASVRTTARPDGDGWRLTGGKIWTSQAHRSSHAYVLCRTSKSDDKHAGLTELIVDMSAPGVTVRPIIDLRGEHHFNEVTFSDVAVPCDHVLGAVGNGWAQVTEQLSFERGGMERVLSTYPLLAATIDAGPADRAVLGEMLARLAGLRGLAWQIAAELDAGHAPVQAAAVLKDLGTEFERDVNEAARAVLDVEPDPNSYGPAGLLAQGLLAAPGFSIRGGTTEVLRTIIARGASRPTAHHDELRSLADDVLAGHGGDPAGVPAIWSTVCELGWTTIGVPESQGGSGGDLADLAAFVEGLGRHGVSVPLAETALAARQLAAAGRGIPDGIATIVLPGLAETLEVVPDRLRGKVTRVPWASTAQTLIVYAGELVLAVPADTEGVRITPGQNLAAEPRDDVSLDVALTDTMILTGAEPAAEVSALAGLLVAAGLVGALDAAVEHTRTHVTTREQFGRPLLKFQAVAQTLAQMTSELVLARTAVSTALADPTPAHVAVARVLTGRAATSVARGAHQLHGAMGVTREHPLHLSTRRLWSWRDERGTTRSWAVMLGESLIPGGSAKVWQWLTSLSPSSRRETPVRVSLSVMEESGLSCSSLEELV